VPRGSNKTDSEAKYGGSEKQSSNVRKVQQSIRLRCPWRDNGKEKRSGDKDRSHRSAGACYPSPKGGKVRFIDTAEHDKRKNDVNAGMSMASAPHIVSQRIVIVAWNVLRQKAEKRKASIHNRGQND